MFTENMDTEKMLSLIESADIYEYGVFKESFTAKLNEYKNSGKAKTIIAAIDNVDTDEMLLEVLYKNSKEVICGMKAVANILSISEMVIYLPEGKDDLVKIVENAAKELNTEILIKTGIVDVREYREAFITHVETMTAVNDVLEGKKADKALIQIKEVFGDDTKLSEIKELEYGKAISDIFDTSKVSIKAVEIGYKLYDKSILQQPVTKETVLGTGVITLYDKSCCMVHISKDLSLKMREHSCGKCTFCREGFIQLDMRHGEIVSKKGELDSIGIMKDIGKAMNFSCECSVGTYGANDIVDILDKFENEYISHIKKKDCPEGVCKAFTNIYIDPDKCIGCTKCIKACPIDCIEGKEGYIHMIEDMDCTKCEECIKVCPQNAVVITKKRTPSIPNRLTRVGRFKQY
ncbi:MAG: 4Fe-4S binding protein [Lachnospiraceae bacterium]|jgi:ferredoxin|nr:4Fe-4S binding protein [Lachnospiraceae bacterium]